LGFFYMRDREEQASPHLAPTPPVVSELLHHPRPVEGALFVYEASAPLTVESSDVLQRLPLTSYQGEAKTTLTLCPAQGASAYRRGTLINPTAAPLLPGPIDLFYDGLLLRRGVLPLVMENGQLQLELGIEQRLRATRRVEEQRLRRGLIKEMDLVERSLEFSISSGLSVESELSLLEPLPWSEEVELLQSVTHADPLPEESPEQLTWALNIAPGSARTVSCRYQIRYPSRYQLQWEER
ncbi:MAG: DUF4139 domain-containing protein, partial [Myxococcota bacterium]|nr:DUF4139 domain-containing protein [Myxococcota bacterium]